MSSPAQVAATAKYIKNHTRRFTIQLSNERDAAMIAHLEAQPNVTQYIKALIAADMGDEGK